MKHNYFILTIAALLVYIWAGISVASAQAYPNIGLGWNTEMGCSIFDSEGRALMEELEDLPCLQVCEFAQVQYWPTSMPSGATIEWTVIGGTYISQPNNGILVTWSNNSLMSVVFIEVTLDDGTILEYSICVEMVGNPIAGFTLPPPGEVPVFCVGQEIFFTNTSIPNAGGQLVDFHWNFGGVEGVTSNEYEPSFIYNEPGNYVITLTVWNECRCSDTYKLEVVIEELGEPVEIECPTVTCEDSIEMYSANIRECNDPIYTWVVEGGTILNNTDHHPVVEVLWDKVDDTGFGWVTLYLEGCDVCPMPSTVKVPVVKNIGYILPGNPEEPETLCKGSQYRFYLPQWPSTEFEWSLFDAGGTDYSSLLTFTDQRNEIIVNLLPPAANSLPPGEYTLRSNYFNTLKGCTGYAEKELRILEAPHIITGPRKACDGEVLAFQTVQSHPQTNWVVTNSEGFVQNHSGINFSTSLPPGLYVLTANAPGRCTGEGLTFNVYEYPPTPIGDFTLPAEVCPDVTYTVGFTNTAPNVNPNLYNITWVVANGKVEGSNIGQEIEVNFDEDPTGDYTVSVSYTRKNNPRCPSNWLVSGVIDPISVNTVIEPFDVDSGNTITTNQFCTSTETHFRVDETEGDEYIWTVTPSNYGSVVEGQGTREIKIMWNEEDDIPADVTLKIRKCTEWFTVPVYAAELIRSPEITLDIPAQVCAEAEFDVLVISAVPITTYTSMEMTLFDGAPPHTAPSIISSTEFLFENVAFPPIHDGNILHNISVTIKDPNGCLSPSTITGQITVIPSPVADIVPNLPTTTFCNLADLIAANLELTAISQNGLVQINQWEWYHSTTFPTPPYNSLNNFTAVHTVQDFGYYIVKGEGANGCSTFSDPLHVKEYCPPNGGDNPPNNPCPNEFLSISTTWISCNTIQATASSTSPPLSYGWHATPSNRISLLSTSGNTALFEVTDPGIYTINGSAAFNCGTLVSSSNHTILYQPLMHYGVECLPNGDYAVTLYNDSPYISGQAPDHTIFYHNSTSVDYPGNNEDEHTFVVPPGIHDFHLEIKKAGYPDCASSILTLDLTPPDASFTLPSFACAGDNGYGDVLTFQPDNPNPDHTYRWVFSETANLNMETPVVLFNDYGTPYQEIILTVTDRYGCTATSTVPIDIFLSDFGGEINGHEDPVCEGDTVTLGYEAPFGEIPPSTYQWLLDETEIPGATGPTYNAGIRGMYNLLVSDVNGCFQLLEPVRVTIIPKPIVRITGPETACAGQPFTLNGSSGRPDYARQWSRNGLAISAFNNSTSLDITQVENNPGTYTYSLQVGNPALDECTSTEVFNIEVMPMPDPQFAQMSFQVVCNPFEVVATITNPDPNGTYNWSNGDFGTQTTINHSGLLGVNYTSEWGCSIWTSEIIPKLPEEHLWVFPSGCVEICERRDPDSYVIGPFPIYDSHEWVWQGNSGNPQYDVEILPEDLQMSGTLQLQLGTDILGTFCEITTDALNISFSHEGCRPCRVDEINVEVEDIRVGSNYPFVFYDVSLMLSNNHGMPLTYQLSSPDGVYVPATFNVNPGQVAVNTQFYPNAGFVGGSSTVIVRIFYNGAIFCEFEIELDFPDPNHRMMEVTDPLQLSLMPNPADYSVMVSYDLQEGKSGSLALYSLTGVAHIEQPLFDNKGTVSLNLTSLSSGTYIVVLRDDTGQRKQQVLIKK